MCVLKPDEEMFGFELGLVIRDQISVLRISHLISVL